MANLLVHTVDHYSLCPQVGWFTCNNASSNDMCLMAFADMINADKEAGVKGCMEHTINPTAGCLITTLSPTSACKLFKKIKVAFKHVELEGKDVDLDALEADLEEMNDEGEDDGGDNQEDKEFGVGDPIGKALALVKQTSWENMADLLQFSKFDKYYVALISVAVEVNNNQGTSDLHAYLTSPLEQTNDIHHQSKYPTLLYMARDYFAHTRLFYSIRMCFSSVYVWTVQFMVQTLTELELPVDHCQTEPLVRSTVLLLRRTGPMVQFLILRICDGTGPNQTHPSIFHSTNFEILNW
ncbi:hypothetical protein BDR05DRAFT_947909 [Suillus weaverae]|nr:hypothetical protein BDR05DRAFT_947909 [Suillus weaverae]